MEQELTEKFELTFTPESDEFINAVKEYNKIWETESVKIIQAMQEVSGLKFPKLALKIIVFEGVSNLSWDDDGNYTLKLRASYSPEVKKATMVHELGHLLIRQIIERPTDLDEHRILFLFLYDVWFNLYGKEFADSMVGVEKKRRGVYDYDSAWTWALSLSQEERQKKFESLIS